MSARNFITTLALVALLAGEPTAQSSRPGDHDALRAAYDALRGELESAAARPDARTQRRRLMVEFLDRYRSEPPSAPTILTVRCRLGTLLLTEFDHSGARREFDAVLRHASRAQLDLRGRAKYGLAQAYELAGNVKQAAAQLRRLRSEARGTRYARFAEIALARLERGDRNVVGMPAPEFGPRLDIDGKPRRLADLLGAPACVMFCSANDEAGLRELGRWLATLEEAGDPPPGGVLFVMHLGSEPLGDLAARRGWSIPVIECEREFLDPAMLALGITELPSLILVGPDGTALARNPTARRLAEALGKLR